MSFIDICYQIQDIGFLRAFRESAWVYPIILSTHLSSIAVFGGMILMTDLRLMGWAMRDVSVTDVVRQLRVWKRIGLVIMVTCGLLLALSEAVKYHANPYFYLKMTLLLLVGVHALVFHRTVYGNTEAFDRAQQVPRIAKVAAIISLVLWISIASAGRWIAYWDSPKVPVTSVRPVNQGAPVSVAEKLAVHSAGSDLRPSVGSNR